MQNAYLVQHAYTLDKEEYITTIKEIGIYSSEETAKVAIKRLGEMPGFCHFPKLIDPLIDDEEDGFYIDAYGINVDHWETGFFSCGRANIPEESHALNDLPTLSIARTSKQPEEIKQPSRLYLLQHVHSFDSDGQLFYQTKTIGIYSSRNQTVQAIERLSKKEGFCDYPDLIKRQDRFKSAGFFILPFIVDMDGWNQGFDFPELTPPNEY